MNKVTVKTLQDDEIASLKVQLRSLVIASPTPVTLNKVLQKYRVMAGRDLPYQKFGFEDPVSFLEQKFSDCFVLERERSNPVLTPLVPASLSKFNKLISTRKI